MIAWVADALLTGCEAVAVNASQASAAAAWAQANEHVLFPDAPGSRDGPLAGVLEGLRWAAAQGAEGLVTAPCDTPALPPDFAARMIAALAEAPCAYAVSPDGPHPPCAAWRTDRLPLLETVLADEHPSIRELLDSWGAARVGFANAAPFANINTPLDASTLARTTP